MEKRPDFNVLRLEVLESELPAIADTVDLPTLERLLERYHLAGRQHRALRQWLLDHSVPGLTGFSREICYANKAETLNLFTQFSERFQALYTMFQTIQQRLGSDEFLFDFSKPILGEDLIVEPTKKSPEQMYEDFMLKTGAWKWPKAEREARMKAIEDEELRTGERLMPHRPK